MVQIEIVYQLITATISILIVTVEDIVPGFGTAFKLIAPYTGKVRAFNQFLTEFDLFCSHYF